MYSTALLGVLFPLSLSVSVDALSAVSKRTTCSPFPIHPMFDRGSVQSDREDGGSLQIMIQFSVDDILPLPMSYSIVAHSVPHDLRKSAFSAHGSIAGGDTSRKVALLTLDSEHLFSYNLWYLLLSARAHGDSLSTVTDVLYLTTNQDGSVIAKKTSESMAARMGKGPSSESSSHKHAYSSTTSRSASNTYNVDIQITYDRLNPEGSDFIVAPLPYATIILEDANGTQIHNFTLDVQGCALTSFSTEAEREDIQAWVMLFNDHFSFRIMDTVSGFLLRPPHGASLEIGKSGDIRTRAHYPAGYTTLASLARTWDDLNAWRIRVENVLGIHGVPPLSIVLVGIEIAPFWFVCPPYLVCPSDFVVHLPEQYLQNAGAIAHEYGHHVMNHLIQGGIPHTPAGVDNMHSFCPAGPINPQLALSEGYATAFSLWIRQSHIADVYDFELYVCDADRNLTTSEGRIVAALYDLMDNSTKPECNNGDPNLGLSFYCDDTGGQMFTPQLVLRDSFMGPPVYSITEWWERLATKYAGQLGWSAGCKAMAYNYFAFTPSSMCSDV